MREKVQQMYVQCCIKLITKMLYSQKGHIEEQQR